MMNNKKLLVICPFPQDAAAAQRLKYEQYFSHWRENGFEIDVVSFMDRPMWNIVYKKGNFIKKIAGTIRGMTRAWKSVFTAGRYDLVYVSMYVSPVGTHLLERLVRQRAKKLVYDIEDNVMIGQSNSVNPITALLRSKNKFDFLIKTADHVISSSPALNDICTDKNRYHRATYVSSSMDTERFIPLDTRATKDKVSIGWTGTFSSRVYLDLLRPVFVKLKQFRDFKLIVIGNFQYDFPGMDLEVIQWSLETEVADLQKIDIGVYPLPSDEWVSGKSGLKAIQYMTMGIPAVADNVGNTPYVITDRVDGFLVSTQDDWVKTLVTLIDSPELRREIGNKARETAEKRFSKNTIKEQYLNILKNV